MYATLHSMNQFSIPMRKRRLNAVALLALAGLLLAQTTAAQDLTLDAESRLWIDGTSNRDDWTVHAREISGSANASDDAIVPNELEVIVDASRIESGESTIMDRLIRQALKVSEHPTITYELVRAEATDGDDAVLRTTGRLTLGGVTNEIEMDVEGERSADGSLRFTGSTPLKMTDYDLTPPTAMFGALRTADDVTVHFDVTFVPAG